jgi:hypothetical protein
MLDIGFGVEVRPVELALANFGVVVDGRGFGGTVVEAFCLGGFFEIVVFAQGGAIALWLCGGTIGRGVCGA